MVYDQGTRIQSSVRRPVGGRSTGCWNGRTGRDSTRDFEGGSGGGVEVQPSRSSRPERRDLLLGQIVGVGGGSEKEGTGSLRG